MYQIESLLSARLFLSPQVVRDRIYFISNLSGKLSLYSMRFGGSIPEPLLPPHIALQNPHLTGNPYRVFPELGKILVMLDNDGDENYQPMLIPTSGGFPEPAFNNFFKPFRVHLGECKVESSLVLLNSESRTESKQYAYLGNLKTGELTLLAESTWGAYPDGSNADCSKIIIAESYTVGDNVLFLWDSNTETLEKIYGKTLTDRQPGEEVPLNSIGNSLFVNDERSLLVFTSLFEDTYSLAVLDLDNPSQLHPVSISGLVHKGSGEFNGIAHLYSNHYILYYNIDGCSWVYSCHYNHDQKAVVIEQVLVGQGEISNGVLESIYYDNENDRFSLAFSTATSPTQIYTLEGPDYNNRLRHSNERLLGIESELLSPGEDASYISHDGLRISARLYLPAPSLDYPGPRPIVYYIHGGPQSQERPDFAWFSMPIIQFLTLNGFAVFVPNVRGSSGYGFSYMKHVDHDWGGQDRLDHVYAMTNILPADSRLDVSRSAVVGRSYGGYMTLTLAGRHPELWSAACDMFGPYDLLTFMDRLPETWKPYFNLAVGDPEIPAERQMLTERSPKTYLANLACPMLVIQGANDPRVIERESHDVVEQLRVQGKSIEYLMFPNEGHDVLKYENRVTCYNAITEFFKKELKP